jgi:hypothetical protein
VVHNLLNPEPEAFSQRKRLINMASDKPDPRMISIKPRIRYNTIGGVNGPLVILENVRYSSL